MTEFAIRFNNIKINNIRHGSMVLQLSHQITGEFSKNQVLGHNTLREGYFKNL